MASWRDYPYPDKYTQSGAMGPVRFFKEINESLPTPTASFEGLTVIVTGANVGLGLAAARHVARLNAANLILAVRTISKGEKAKEELIKSCPDCKTQIHVMELDMASFASVKTFAENVRENFDGKIDFAILNAGLANFSWTTTKDGWETSLQVNVLSTAYLTLLLFPMVRASYDSSKPFSPVIEIVSSDAHYSSQFPERENLDPAGPGILATLNDETKFKWNDRYQTTKLLEIFFARSLADYIESKNLQDEIIITTSNPGPCQSDLMANQKSLVAKIFLAMFIFFVMRFVQRTADEGTKAYIWPLTQGKAVMGQYTSVCEVQRPAKWIETEEGEKVQKKVWQEIGDFLMGLDKEGVKEFF